MTRVAVLIPCLNEAAAIGDVVAGFRRALPTAQIFVYDNGSTDRTIELARAAGAIVRSEPTRGKGSVVRRMFADVQADIYVMVDGDGTYDPDCAPAAIERLQAECLDLVTITRDAGAAVHRPGHAFGNQAFTWLLSRLFQAQLGDVFSGYRVISRRFVKTFPAFADGFAVETEMTVHALAMRAPTAEMPGRYGVRREGSHSKLNTVRDGLRILMTIGRLVTEERPLPFFSILAALLTGLALLLGLPLVREFLETGLVPRLPTAVGVVGLIMLSGLLVASGLILDTVRLRRYETKRLAYLAHDGVEAP
ncbi:MAG: glycosyltransferase [Elsteraceae bacterium]